jgi:dienelactone hydrolase
MKQNNPSDYIQIEFRQIQIKLFHSFIVYLLLHANLFNMKTLAVVNVILLYLATFILVAYIVPPSPKYPIKEENITYKADSLTVKGFIAYDEKTQGKRPAVLVVHEWWGLNDYTKMRARKLAESGYIAMAVDLFGNGKNAANPKEAMELTAPFYKNPQLAKNILDAALKKIKEYPQTDKDKITAIGYCFGGAMVLNYAKLGAEVKAVVSFHGGLTATVPVDKNLLKAKILVCHGGDDKFISQKDIDAFKHQLDSIAAIYTFKTYPNATHAFTNPDATRIGIEFNLPIEYNARADEESWNDMRKFFGLLFKN